MVPLAGEGTSTDIADPFLDLKTHSVDKKEICDLCEMCDHKKQRSGVTEAHVFHQVTLQWKLTRKKLFLLKKTSSVL